MESPRCGSGKEALARTGLKLEQMDLIECNEAFAAQTISVERGLRWDRRRLNVNGGAIALGHPLGSTGGKLTATIIYELREGRAGMDSLRPAPVGNGGGHHCRKTFPREWGRKPGERSQST